MAQTFDVARFLKSAFAGLAPDEALRQPPGVLLGVSAGAQAALETLGVRTVFDLAASRVFATARALLAIQRDPTTAEARLNVVAADAVDAPAGMPVTELADQPIAILRGVGSANAPALGAAVDVSKFATSRSGRRTRPPERSSNWPTFPSGSRVSIPTRRRTSCRSRASIRRSASSIESSCSTRSPSPGRPRRRSRRPDRSI